VVKPKISFSPPTLDLVLYAGDGPSFSVVLKDPAGVLIPITGTMKAHIRAERDAPDPLAVFDIDLDSATNGIAVLRLTGEQTQVLAPSDEKFEGVWDLEWTASGMEPLTICQGKVECFPDVSR